MVIELILMLVIGAWLVVLLFVLALCRAAKSGDDAAEALWLRATAAAGDSELARPASNDARLRALDLDQAAALLGVFPEMLLTWETRYGFPTSSPAEHLYSQSEILALRHTLWREPSIAAAIARARDRTKRPSPRLPAPRQGLR
ncbi:MAG: hypothetical protein JO325_19710 [Solirubrobacterales bacterium]|nr:hypothetical protein [Solirubrobacterales bacterium]